MVASRKASSKYPSYIFDPSESMRSTFLLASIFLAVFPVSLICLAVKSFNQRIPLNQYVHSLYPRPPLHPVIVLFALLRPLSRAMAILIHSMDAASKHTHFVTLSGSGSLTPDGCVRFANRFPSLPYEVPLFPDVTGITVERCIAACNAATPKYTRGGVGNYTCCACFTCVSDEHSFLH